MLRLWSELLPLDALTAPATLSLLARHKPRVLLACWPHTLEPALDALARCTDAGLSVGLWPMLDDARGRWCNTGNTQLFLSLCDSVREEAARRGLPLVELAVDLEPDLARMERWLRGTRPREPRHAPTDPEGHALAQWVHSAQREGLVVSAALAPFVLFDSPARPRVASWLGTLWEHIRWDHVTFMAYSSLAEGWSRGLCSRGLSQRLIRVVAREAKRRLGARAGVSVGCVGTGALGDEPVYASLEALVQDARAVRVAGVCDGGLYDLRGVLQRDDPARWLDAWASAASDDAAGP